MPVFSEPPWPSPNPGSWPAVGAHNFAAASPNQRFDPRGLVHFSPPPRSPSSASTASTAPSRGDSEFREARSPFVGLASYDNCSVPERFDHFLQQPVWPSVQLGVDDEIYQSLGSQNELDIACHSALPDLINGDDIPAFVGVLTRELKSLGTFSVAHRLHPRPLRDAGLWELCSGLRVDCVLYAFFCFPPHPTPSRASAPSRGPRFRSYIPSRSGVRLRLTPSSCSVPHFVLLRSPRSLRLKLWGSVAGRPT